MSRLPTTSQIATTPRRLSRQPSLDLRKRKTISENVPPVPSLTKARSRSFIGDQQHTYTALNTPRSSLISPTAVSSVSPASSVTSGPPYIGDRVAVDSMGIVGTLKFLGEAEFKEGYWAGIQLDIVGSGKNDGSVKGYYFLIFCIKKKVPLLKIKIKITNNLARDIFPVLQIPAFSF